MGAGRPITPPRAKYWTLSLEEDGHMPKNYNNPLTWFTNKFEDIHLFLIVYLLAAFIFKLKLTYKLYTANSSKMEAFSEIFDDFSQSYTQDVHSIN
jgi:hypothetical protein